MKVRRFEFRLQSQGFVELGIGLGKLIPLSKQCSQFIAQVSAIRRQLHRAAHLRERFIARLLAENSSQHAMRLRVLRRDLHRGARLLLALGRFPLLRQHTGQR